MTLLNIVGWCALGVDVQKELCHMMRVLVASEIL